MNILSGYEHVWGILFVILIGGCTAASVPSLSCFLCIEIKFSEKAHFRSIVERHTRLCTCSAFIVDTISFSTQFRDMQIRLVSSFGFY